MGQKEARDGELHAITAVSSVLSALAVNSVLAACWVCLAEAHGDAGWKESSATSHKCQAMAFC